MTVQFIKVTKKDRVCYAPVPEPLEEGDKLEIMEMKDEALFPPAGKNARISLSRNPMVFVKMNDGFQRILMKNILYVEAGGSYCTLHVHGMPAILVSAPLARVSEHLDGEYFIRVHRSYLVNKLHIESIAGNFLQVGVVAIPISKFMKKKSAGQFEHAVVFQISSGLPHGLLRRSGKAKWNGRKGGMEAETEWPHHSRRRRKAAYQ